MVNQIYIKINYKLVNNYINHINRYIKQQKKDNFPIQGSRFSEFKSLEV